MRELELRFKRVKRVFVLCSSSDLGRFGRSDQEGERTVVKRAAVKVGRATGGRTLRGGQSVVSGTRRPVTSNTCVDFCHERSAGSFVTASAAYRSFVL